MSDAEDARARISLGPVAAMFMRRADWANGEALRLASEQEQMMAALAEKDAKIATLSAKLDAADERQADLTAALIAREGEISERDREIADLKQAAAVVRLEVETERPAVDVEP